MHKKKIALFFTALSFAVIASATEVQTTSYHSWLGTVSGSATEGDFNSISSTASYNNSAGYSMAVGTFGPVAVTGPDGSGYSLTKNSSYGPSSLITLEGSSDGIGNITMTTPSGGMSAFLFGIGISGNAAPITVTLSDGETFAVNPTVGGNNFLGLSSGTPITSFVLSTAAGSQVELTDFFAAVSSQPAATPSAPAAEAATALMIGGGLLLIGARRKVFSNLTRATRHRKHVLL